MERRTLARHEMIGLGVTIVAARNNSLVGAAGTIVDETRNTLTLENDHILKKVPKEQVVLRVKVDNGEVTIDGKSLVGRPEDRLKKKVKR